MIPRAFPFLFVLLVHAAFGAEPEVSFSRQIAPILQSKCLGCHGPEKAKGGYRVHTYESLGKTGKSKEVPLVPGKPDDSELFKRLTTTDPDDRMPQKDEPLTKEQIDLFRSWITSGALLDRGQPNTLLASITPRAPHPAPPEKYRRPLPILALSFTPNRQELAASGHHEVTFWNLQGELVRRLTNVPQRVRSLAFASDGHFLAVAGGQPGRSGELAIYHLASGSRETNLLETSDEILCVAFSADGKRLACAGTDNAIHLFDWEKRARTHTIQQHADWVTALSFNTNGTQIASASRDRTARVYDAVSGDLEATYPGQVTALNVVACLADGNIISGGRDKSIHIWNIKDGKKKYEIGGFAGDIYALVAIDEEIFIAGADGAIRVHSLADRKLIRTLKGHGDAVYALTFEPASQKLASGSYDGTVNVWNVRDGSLEKSFVAAPGWTSVR